MKYYKYLKIILIAIPFFVLLFLFNKQYPLNGKLKLVYDFSRPNAYIHKLTPDGRLDEIKKENGEYFQTIKIDPVYFDIELPDNYEKVSIKLKYQSKNQPIIKIGGAPNSDLWRFETVPVQNTIIDEISEKWHKIEQNGTILLQKKQRFNTISDFIHNLPPIEEVAVFNYNLAYDYVYPNYQPNESYYKLSAKLQGGHSFYTYLGEGERMDFNFSLQVLDTGKTDNQAQVEVYQNGGLIKDYKFNLTAERELKVDPKNLSAGFYKINLLLDDNILINEIFTKQKLVAFVNKLKFFKQDEPVKLVSNSSVIKAATDQTSGLQTIKVDDQNLVIDDINSEFFQKTNSAIADIDLQKGNILIQGDGLFSFSKEQFFNPQVTVLNTAEKLKKINYIITGYQPADRSLDNWIIGKADFNISGWRQKNNRIKMMISAPSLNSNGGEIRVGEIKVTLEQRPLWVRVKNKLNK